MKNKILFVHHLPVIGGATKSLLQLCVSLKSKDFVVEVLFFHESGNAYKIFNEHNIKCHYFSSGKVFQHAYGAYIPLFQFKFYRLFLSFFLAMASIIPSINIIKKIKPDLVYLNTSLLFPVAIASKFLSIKNIWHIREQLHDGNFGIRKFLLIQMIKFFPNKVLVISETNKKALKLKNSTLIYNSVKVNKENNFIEKNKCNLNNQFTITFLGGNVKSKGGDLIVQAFTKLLKKHDNIKLIYAGFFRHEKSKKLNKIEKNVYKILNENRKIQKKIAFTGALENINPILKDTSVLVWPATTPHFSRPIIEAMMFGKIVLGTDYPSTREVIDENISGFLCKPEANDIKKKLDYIIKNFKSLEFIQKNSQKKALRLFNHEKNINKNIKIIKEIIKS